MSTFNRRLKQIVAKSGRVSFDELNAAMETARTESRSLASVLSRQGLLDNGETLGLISQEIGFPPLDLSRVMFDDGVKDAFPADMARKYQVVPISKLGSCLTLAMADPFDIVKIDQLRLETRCEIRPVIALEESLDEAMQRLYDAGSAEMAALLEHIGDDAIEIREGRDDEQSLDLEAVAGSGDSPAVRLVNMMVSQAIRERASDIHIEPYERQIRVRYRQDGVCREVLTPPKNLQSAIVSRIKIMARMDIAERGRPQDGKFQVRMEGRAIDFRVSTLPMVHGEKVVMRILDGGNLTLSLDHLGFEEKALLDYRHAIRQPYGMILITGPTGSGKSTTLYSALKEIYSDEINFVTVEDPVEYQLDGINQVPVNPKRGLTFSTALRSILRQDPDVVMIGEIRDKETLEIAVKAALTGHLVLSTLHTNDAPSTVTRMVDMGLDPFLVSSSVLLICAQRLMRRLCEQCKQEVQLPRERLLSIGFREEDFEEPMTLFQAGSGCSRCSNGYRGRFAVLETLPLTDSLRRMIVTGKGSLEIKTSALAEGMMSLRRSAILNAMRGKTSVEEVLRVTLAD